MDIDRALEFAEIDDKMVAAHIRRAGLDITPEQVAVTPVGALYRTDFEGILPSLVRTYMAKRKDTKTEMLKVEQIIEDAPWNKENAIQDARARLEALLKEKEKRETV